MREEVYQDVVAAIKIIMGLIQNGLDSYEAAIVGLIIVAFVTIIFLILKGITDIVRLILMPFDLLIKSITSMLIKCFEEMGKAVKSVFQNQNQKEEIKQPY